MAQDPRKSFHPELSKKELKELGSVLRHPQPPSPSAESLETLQDLIFYWLILGPDVAEERIARSMRHAGGDPVTVGAIITFAEHYAELLRPGTIHRDLVESWDKRNSEEERLITATKLSVKIGNPVYRGKKPKAGEKNNKKGSRWGQYGEAIIGKLAERHERNGYFSLDKAFEQEVTAIIQSPADKSIGLLGSDKFVSELQYYIQELPVEYGEALKELRKNIEEILFNDLFGSEWRSKYKPVSLSDPMKSNNEEERDSGTIEDVVEDKKLIEDAEQQEGHDTLNNLIIKANSSSKTKLTPSEEKVFRAVYDGLTPESIAEDTGINVAAIYVHLCNARKKIKKVYVKPEADTD